MPLPYSFPSPRGEVSIPTRRWTVFGLADQEQRLPLLKQQEAASFTVNFIILPVLIFGQDTLFVVPQSIKRDGVS